MENVYISSKNNFEKLHKKTSHIKAKKHISLAHHISDVLETWFIYFSENKRFVENYWKKNLRNILPFQKLLETIFFLLYFHDIGKATSEFQMTIENKDRKSYHPLYATYILTETPFSFKNINIPLLAIMGHHSPFYFDQRGYLYKDKISNTPTFLSEYRWFFDFYPTIYESLIHKRPNNIPTYILQKPNDIRKFLISTKLQLQNLASRNKKILNKLYLILSGSLIFSDRIASMKEFKNNEFNYFWLEQSIKLYLEANIKEFKSWKDFQNSSYSSNSSLLLEIPTGEGKTEAALLWAQNNLRNKFTRLIYTLPTRVTSNKMYDRLKSACGNNPIAIVHGGGKLKFEEEFPENSDKQQLTIRYSINRTFCLPITVSTLDSYLLPFLHFGRWDLSQLNLYNSLTIIDEIHSYNPRILGFLIRILKLQERNGNKFVLMSASIPDVVKNKFKEELDFSHLGGIDKEKELFNKSPGELIKVEDSILETKDKIIKFLNSGKNVLVVLNTVKDAKKLYSSVIKNSKLLRKQVVLYHSEFSKIDRQYKETEIYYRLGKIEKLNKKRLIFSNNEVQNLTSQVSNAKNKPFVLIATQVVEISLDINFDILFTELAPIDAIIQRIGRANRQKIPDKKARIFVYNKLNTGKTGWYYPYKKKFLDETWNVLENGRFTIKDTLDWLNSVYTVENTFQDSWFKKEFDEGFCMLDKVLDITKGISRLRLSEEYLEKFILRSIEKNLKHVQVIPIQLHAAFLSENKEWSFKEWYKNSVDVYYYKIKNRSILKMDDVFGFKRINQKYDYQHGVLWKKEAFETF